MRSRPRPAVTRYSSSVSRWAGSYPRAPPLGPCPPRAVVARRPPPRRDEIQLFGEPVVVLRGRPADGDRGLGETLVDRGGRDRAGPFADLRAVLGEKRLDGVVGGEMHGAGILADPGPRTAISYASAWAAGSRGPRACGGFQQWRSGR